MKTWIASVATLSAIIGAAPGQSRADHRLDIDELACLLRQQAADACREIRYHFIGAPNYRHLYSDTYELYRQADRIHELVHRGRPLAEICAAVDELDELYHHVEDVLREVETCDWARGVSYHRRYSRFHEVSLRHGGFHSYHVRRLKVRIQEMGDTIHALDDEVHAGSQPGRGRGVEPPLPPEALPGVAPTYGPAFPLRPTGPAFPAGRRAMQFGKKDGLSFTLYLGR